MPSFVTRAQVAAGNVGDQIRITTNKVIPPRQREEKLKELRLSTNRNPKLATFLAIQIALLGFPLLIFITFAVSTLLISLATSLLVALTSALIYTFFVVGIALFFLVPTLFIASWAATCFFFWGLSIYLILQRLNDGQAPAKRGTRVGDKLRGLTGDRLDWLVGGQEEKKPFQGYSGDAAPRTNGSGFHIGGGSQARHGGDGHFNEAGEWEQKWASGTQQKQVEFAENLDIKFETP